METKKPSCNHCGKRKWRPATEEDVRPFEGRLAPEDATVCAECDTLHVGRNISALSSPKVTR